MYFYLLSLICFPYIYLILRNKTNKSQEWLLQISLIKTYKQKWSTSNKNLLTCPVGMTAQELLLGPEWAKNNQKHFNLILISSTLPYLLNSFLKISDDKGEHYDARAHPHPANNRPVAGTFVAGPSFQFFELWFNFLDKVSCTIVYFKTKNLNVRDC